MPNTVLLNPITGTFSFGSVPDMVSRGINLQGGEIRLMRGKHTGPNKGFGASHIWIEHSKEMTYAGYDRQESVPD